MFERKLWVAALSLSLAVAPAFGKKEKPAVFVPLTPEQAQLVDEAMAREKVTVKEIAKHTPVVQTYIQNLKPDPVEYQVPVSDQYIIGRVDFGKTFGDEQYDARTTHRGLLHGSLQYITGLSKAFELSYSPTGFMDMMFIDPIGFDHQHYEFNFIKKEFLGSVRTTVFDVRPKAKTGAGRFFGRIWVEEQEGNIVRFNGTYSSAANDEETHYYHFDSWRSNLQEGVWLPAVIYVEESDHAAAAKAKGFRAQTMFWGYSLKLPQSNSDNSSMEIENAQDQSENSQDVSPLQAQRLFITQAENNVLDRLVTAGLIAPPSDYDKILETVVNNIVIGNNLTLPSDLHCRVILTQPLESMSVGNTILLSKGLIDTLPTEEDLAAVLSFELAHIVLGHHIDTRYAFNDRLLFPDQAAFERILMNHNETDNEAAAKKAVELFEGSVYKDKAASVGLFFEQLQVREKNLTALLSPRLGDALIKPDGTPWLAALGKGAPKLDVNNLTQIAALPIGSHTKTDPWNDKILALNAKFPVLLNAADKLPFALTPVYLRLQRYQANAETPASTPAQPGAQPTGGQNTGQADAGTQAAPAQVAPAQGTVTGQTAPLPGAPPAAPPQ